MSNIVKVARIVPVKQPAPCPPAIAKHPAMRKLAKAAQCRASFDFDGARAAIVEADLCLAQNPIDGAEKAMVRAKKLLWMEEKAHQNRMEQQRRSQKRLNA